MQQREAKFRAMFKNMDTGRNVWITIGVNERYDQPGWAQVSPWVQYTGLKDKNWRELYFDCDLCMIEGDESLWYATKDDFGIPCWVPANGGLGLHIEFSSYFLNGTRRRDAFEIIGNVFEHPELLK